MNEELGRIISKLRGALYLAERGRLAEVKKDLDDVDCMRSSISWLAVPAIAFRDVVILTLGGIEGNRYLVEFDALERSIDRLLFPDDTEEVGLVKDPLEGLTGSELLRLALERILEEKGVTYKELTDVKTAWHPQAEDLELELIVTKRMTVTTA